jgi:hypothetical protein
MQGITMRKIITSIATISLLLLSMSASADVAQAWECQLVDGKTNDDLLALSKSWLDAAKETDKNASVRVYFPIATDAEGGSMIFVFYLPDFKSWGEFMDAYPDSPAAQVDAGWDDVAPCKVSGLWLTEDIE